MIRFIRIIQKILFWLVTFIDIMLGPDPDLELEQEIPFDLWDGYNWAVVTDARGDKDVIPLREDHLWDSDCPCNPRVDVIGANVIRVHNSYDGREILEEARDIIEGGKPNPCDGGEESSGA